MRELRYGLWLMAALAGTLLSVYPPVFLGRVNGITVLGAAIVTLAIIRIFVLRSMERLNMDELTNTNPPLPTILDMKKVLDFEETHPNTAPGKHEAIRRAFGVTPTRYYARLVQIIRTEEGIAYNPQLVSRLNRAAALAADRRALRAGAVSRTDGPADIRARRIGGAA